MPARVDRKAGIATSAQEPSGRRASHNQIAIAVATFIGFAGFTLVMPFLPLYFAQLGVSDVGDVALWAGLSLGVTPAMTALLGPLWGRMADRFGRKIMVERSLLSFVVVMAAIAYVTEPWHVFALRAVQGFFSGYASIAIAMAAESAEPGAIGAAIGRVQAAQRLGVALGPVLGGGLAHLVGLRRAFLVAAAFFLVAFILVLVAYREPARTRQTAAKGTGRVTFRSVLAFQNFMILMSVVFGLQFVERSFGPILPLLVADIGTATEHVPIIAGALFSIAAGTGAAGHHFSSRLLGNVSPRVVIAGSAVVGTLAVAVFAVAPGVSLLFIAMPVFGLAIGVALTASYTAAGTVIPPGAHATGFAFLSSAALAALAVSPIVSGFLAATSIRAVFVLGCIALATLAGVVMRVMVDRPLRPEAPAVVEEA